MITLTLDENNQRVCRLTASYLLALAGDLDVTISGTDRPIHVGPTFNAAEIAEAATLPAGIPGTPTPAEIFGGQQVPQPPAAAPSTVDAAASPTVPANIPATISTPAPTVPVPPAPNTASAASHVAAPPASPAPGVELDSQGLPWDARIHARTKSKLANGQWKTARGVDPAMVAHVQQELRNLMAIPASAPAVPTPPPLPPALPAAVPLPPPSATPATPPASGATTASPSDFPSLMLRISGAQTARQINQQQVAQIVAKHGLAGIAQLTQRPDMIPALVADIEAQIAANVAGGVPV